MNKAQNIKRNTIVKYLIYISVDDIKPEYSKGAFSATYYNFVTYLLEKLYFVHFFQLSLHQKLQLF